MHERPFAALALALALLAPVAPPAWSQAEPTVDQIYQAARSGQLQQADAMIEQVLRNHPDSAKAHYVKAELAARESNAAVAREELATAERLAPGLPFVRPDAVQALRDEIEGRSATHAAAQRSAGQAVSPSLPTQPGHQLSWGMAALIAAIAIALFAVFTMLRRRSAGRRPGGPADGGVPRGAGPGGPGPMGGAPGGYPGAPGGPYGAPAGMGSTLGRGLATGLAVGAGAVAAQEIGRRMFGHGDSPIVSSGTPADLEPGLLDPSVNADMGGADFGVNDAGSWDDAGADGDWGSGNDWDT